MNHSAQAGFLLIDGVLSPAGLARLYQHPERPEVLPLYLGTRWDKLHDLGPILLKADPHGSLITGWFSDPVAQANSTLLCSAEPMQTVATHLRHFICAPDAQGGKGLLRFSDPLVAHYWLSSFSVEQRDLRLGPIQHWWVRHPSHRWQPAPEPAWQTFSRTADSAPWEAQYADLGRAQLDALDQARRWKLEEDTYQWLVERNAQSFAGMNAEQLSDWLKRSIDSGLDWGLVGEEALITWAETCVDLGSDFATHTQGAYRDWLHRDPEHGRLAPELRIKAFDHHRHSHKDPAHG